MTAIAHAPAEAGLTRRGLLAAGGATVAALALAEVSRVGGVAGVLGDAGVPAYLRRSSFTALVGDTFGLEAPAGRTVARLVAVDSIRAGAGPASRAGTQDAFALAFHASGGARLEQDVMTLTHPRLGRFRLLVAPSGTGRRGQDYTAVINRAPPPGRTGGTRVRAVPR